MRNPSIDTMSAYYSQKEEHEEQSEEEDEQDEEPEEEPVVHVGVVANEKQMVRSSVKEMSSLREETEEDRFNKVREELIVG